MAIFIALSGSAIAANVASQPGAQKAAKKKKAKRGPPGPAGPQGPAGEVGPPGPATGPAGGALSGNYPNPGLAPPPAWQNITFATGWANGGAGIYPPVGCYKDAMDVVHLHGRATRTTGTTTVGTLPVACRPSLWWQNVLVVEVDAGGDGIGALAVFISPHNGGVTVDNEALPAGLNFDGVSFRATN